MLTLEAALNSFTNLLLDNLSLKTVFKAWTFSEFISTRTTNNITLTV
jgi:hypothetical protein